MNNLTKITAKKDKQEIIIEREFDAPRELVFKAFISPEMLIRWLGPVDSKMKIEKLENKTHGSWRFIHYDNAGNEYGFNGVIHDIDEPAGLIRTFEFEGLPERGHVSLEFLKLEELQGNRTKLTIHSVFKSIEERDGMIQSGMEKGLNDGFEKLDRLLKIQ